MGQALARAVLCDLRTAQMLTPPGAERLVLSTDSQPARAPAGERSLPDL